MLLSLFQSLFSLSLLLLLARFPLTFCSARRQPIHRRLVKASQVSSADPLPSAMSQDGDFFLSSSEGLMISDFSTLTELDDFRKDLFLGNNMEAIPEGGLLEELVCKDDLKLISDINDVLEASMKANDDGGEDSMKAQDIPFALFVDPESSGSLQFMSGSSQLDFQTVPADIDLKSMDLTHAVSNSSVKPTAKSDLPSHTALVAANELNCMSLDELEQLAPVHRTDEVCAFPSPLNFEQRVSLGTTVERLHLTSMASSSSLTKDVVGASMLKMDAQAQFSDDLVTPPAQIKTLGRSLSMTFCSSDGSSLSSMPLRNVESGNFRRLKSAPVQSVSVDSKPDSTNCCIFGEVIPEVPSLQRSQSSNSLGQFRMSHCLGSCPNDMQTQSLCKQEVPMLSSATHMGFFSVSPYQATTAQSMTPMRRVYSTGDLQVANGMHGLYGIKAENAIPEDTAGMRIGHYTMEERKMKLHRYRQKRTERNFSKKIKYACRKTLADNRPRVRGRFARSDEMGDSSLKVSDLPLIDEYEAITSHQIYPHVARDQQAHLLVNNSCIMSSTPIAQFWTTMGMKVAM